MNKKVKNATPMVFDEIKFRSKLELFTYKRLKEENIHVGYENIKYELVPSFEFAGNKIRPMTWTPDFNGNGFLIECKGFGNDTWPLKEKLFKWHLVRNKIELDFYVVKNQKEVEEVIRTLRSQRLAIAA
jgi:hypothetical protein